MEIPPFLYVFLLKFHFTGNVDRPTMSHARKWILSQNEKYEKTAKKILLIFFLRSISPVFIESKNQSRSI